MTIKHDTNLEFYLMLEAKQKKVDISENNVVLYERKRARELKIDELDKKFRPYIFKNVDLLVLDLETKKVYRITYDYEASSKIDHITNFNIQELKCTMDKTYFMIDELFNMYMKDYDEEIYIDFLRLRIKKEEDENAIRKISTMVNDSYRDLDDNEE